MELEIRIDGQVAVKMEINKFEFVSSVLHSFLQSTSIPAPMAKSTPMTTAEIEVLLSRIHPKSAQFLQKLAANNGEITWGDTSTIFPEIVDRASFVAGYGKGITKAVRHMLGDASAKLVWWNEDDPEGSFHVDGPALLALQQSKGPPSVNAPSGDIMVAPVDPEKKWYVTQGLPNREPLFIRRNGRLEPLVGVPSNISLNKIRESIDLLMERLAKDGMPWVPNEGMVVRNKYNQGALVRRSGKWDDVRPWTPLHAPPGSSVISPVEGGQWRAPGDNIDPRAR